MGLRFPWDTDTDTEAEAQAEPRPAMPPKRRGRRPASRVAAAGPTWRYHHLIVSGPADVLAAFADAARGAGVTPWRIDGNVLEEDIFHLAASQPAAQRTLTIEGCRILARQFRDRVKARQARAAARVGQSRACPFDLHVLLPVPDPILQLGAAHPTALAWLAVHWGVSDRLRQATVLDAPNAGKRLPAGHGVIGYGFFTGEDTTPQIAVAALAPRWLALCFALRPRPD